MIGLKKLLAKILIQLETILGWNQFSTEEQWTGKYWIDGKKIYRKIDTGTMSGTQKTVALSPTNVNEYLKIDVIHTGKVGFTQNIGWGSYWQAATDYFNYYVIGPVVANNQNISIRGGSEWPKTPYDYYIIIEYTKTTD